MNSSKRSFFWDNYKGILIFLVVLGHFLYSDAAYVNGSLADDLFVFIYLFHMPAFIFCSGYLSKSERSRSKESLIRLLLYFLAFNSLMLVFAYVVLGDGVSFLDPYYSYWYVLSLICWRLCIKDMAGIRGMVPLAFAIALMVGFCDQFSNVLSIRRTIVFFVFFLLGYKLDREKLEAFLAKRGRKTVLLGVALMAVVSGASWWVLQNHDITMSMLVMEPYDQQRDVFWRLFIMVVSLLAILVLLMVVPTKKIPLLTNMGKNSLLIYLAHRFITLIYARLVPHTSYTDMHVIFSLVGSVLVCLLLGYEKLNVLAADMVDWCAVRMQEPTNKVGNMLKAGLLLAFLLMLVYIAI